MLQNQLFREFVEKAKSCENGDIVAIGQLFNFLDETPHMLLFEAVCHELTVREQNLTDKERDSLRAIGLTFYDETDKPVDVLVRPYFDLGQVQEDLDLLDDKENGLL